MSSLTKAFLFWTPRIATIVFALFLSIFAADVFNGQYDFFGTIVALFMHLIPSMLLLLILALSWKWEWIGGMLYITLGIVYIVMSIHKFQLSVMLIIPTPVIIIGILFLVGWFKRKEIRAN